MASLYGACISCGIARNVTDFTERKCICGCNQIVEVCNFCANFSSYGPVDRVPDRQIIINGIINPIGMSKQFCES